MKILLLLLVFGIGSAKADDTKDPPPDAEVPEEPDMCVGCNDASEDEQPLAPQLTVEIRVDPVTGEILYVIKGIVIE